MAVKKNPTSLIFFNDLFTEENDKTFDFSMCNPPFYSNLHELYESRSPARLPPKNGFTGSPQELITEGGELTFCRKMIEESKNCKNKILIFTTMVGHKCNMKELLQDLKADDIKCTSTEFCQGRVTRWGLAWTYQNYDLSKLVPARDKPRKKNLPVTYLLPKLPDISYDVDNISKKIKCILQDLQIDYKILNKRGNNLSMDIVAHTNTWSNQRRKRRLLKSLEFNIAKKPNLQNEETIQNILPPVVAPATPAVIPTGQTDSIKRAAKETKNDTNSSSPDFNACNSNLACGNSELTESNSEAVNPQPVIHAFLKIIKQENDVLLHMEFLDGSAGKEGTHQIMQYIKNNWK